MTEREKVELVSICRQVMHEELMAFEDPLFLLLTDFVERMLNDLAEVIGERKRFVAEEVYKRLSAEARQATLRQRAGFL